jgi:N-acetylglutamate synthase-like GNAT family acetyltransferase
MQGYRITTDVGDMDLKVTHDFLTNSYWSKGIPLPTLRRAIENSMCFAVLTDQGEQVAFARMVTDRATYAYLADVFVVEARRGKGIAKWLVQSILDHPELQGLRRITLATRDAFGLYEKFGFKPLANPQIFMEVWKPDVYQK